MPVAPVNGNDHSESVRANLSVHRPPPGLACAVDRSSVGVASVPLDSVLQEQYFSSMDVTKRNYF
jgi:hypothetical protein